MQAAYGQPSILEVDGQLLVDGSDQEVADLTSSRCTRAVPRILDGCAGFARSLEHSSSSTILVRTICTTGRIRGSASPSWPARVPRQDDTATRWRDPRCRRIGAFRAFG
jgi:hypothetical protein